MSNLNATFDIILQELTEGMKQGDIREAITSTLLKLQAALDVANAEIAAKLQVRNRIEEVIRVANALMEVPADTLNQAAILESMKAEN
jgi:hypothetical protein